MKSLIVLMALLLSTSVLACNREAQFIGEVKNLKTFDNHFTFQVRLTGHFSASVVCPMFTYEVETAVLKYQGTPRIQDGDPISGVMVFDETTQSYKID